MNKLSLALILGGLTFTACDDDTSLIGIEIMPNGDNVTSHSEQFALKTSTVVVDSVLANTSTCYLGCIIDPETKVKTTSNFLAQFHVPDNFKLPKFENMIKDDDGKVFADSCEIRIYFDEYYGDSLTTMKLNVSELDNKNVLDESVPYYTNIDASKYVNNSSPYNKSVTYAIKDLSRPESENSGNTYYRQIVVKLPTKYATQIIQKYYSNPEFFRNSYQFTHNVCPGFYFKIDGGVGSMITTQMMGLNVYFRYHTLTKEKKDTIVDGMQRFGATEEVIQSTTVDNDYPENLYTDFLKQQKCTYVKTPAGFFTEMEIPIKDILSGTHYTDSINQAKITIRKFKNTSDSPYTIAPSQYLLMVRKDNMNQFFESKKLPNNSDTYLSNKFDSFTNVYQFPNIAQMITNIKIERDLGASIKASDSAEDRDIKYSEWERKHPNWNRVMLVPVFAKFMTSTDYYGQVHETLQSVRHNLGLSSSKLEGGNDNPLKIEIIYSRYSK